MNTYEISAGQFYINYYSYCKYHSDISKCVHARGIIVNIAEGMLYFWWATLKAIFEYYQNINVIRKSAVAH